MEATHPEGAGELRNIRRSRCYYTCRKVWKSGECSTLPGGLCEKVPHSATDERDRNYQDLEGQESHGDM
eukprot:12911965-Prorocentrum_lima.AAC.1